MGWFSSACSFVSSCVSSIGSGLSSAASYLGEKFSAVVDMGKSALENVGSFAGDLLRGFGIFKEDETIEEMGDRALQAEVSEQRIFPEQFENFGEYLENLRNFKLDPDLSEKIEPENKIIKGLEVAGRGLDDKFNTPTGTMANVWVLAGMNPGYFTPDRFHSILDSGMDIMSVVDYFEGNLGAGESLELEGNLFDLEKIRQPGKDEVYIYQEIDSAKELIQQKLG